MTDVRYAHTISVYVLIPQHDTDALAGIQAGIERACDNHLDSGYLIETRQGIPEQASDRIPGGIS